MKHRSVILYPLVLILSLFLLDKIFFLPWVVENTYSWKKIERKYYELKEDLILVLEDRLKQHPNESVGIIIGSSRSGEFDSELIAKELPNTVTFNFSAPFAPPSFQSYWIERIQKILPKPKYLLLEWDPLLLSQSSIEYSLNDSYDSSFIWQNIDWFRKKTKDPWLTQTNGFSVDEAETYFLKKLFALYKYPLDFSAIQANNKPIEIGFFPGLPIAITGKEHKRLYIEKIKEANRTKFGALPNEIKFANADFFLEKDAENMYQTYLAGKSLSPTQIYFIDKILTQVALWDVPTVIYFPVVAEPLRKRLEDSGYQSRLRREVEERLLRFQTNGLGKKVFLMDPQWNPKWTCRDFVDSLHLSGACFPNLLPLLFDSKLKSVLK